MTLFAAKIVPQQTHLSRFRKVCYTATAVVLLLVNAEVVGRLVHGWHRHWVPMHRFDPVLGWSLREGWEGHDRWLGGSGQINAQGIRADRPALPKPQGEKRILALGDSITFGALVRTEDAWPGRLDHLLQPRTGWRVLNGGITSYDPAQEADWLERHGWQFQPDVLTVAFCRNDLNPSDRWAPRAREPAGEGLRWLTEHSIVACNLQKAIWYTQACLGQAAPTIQAIHRESLSGWALVEQSYRRIAHSARERGVPVVLVIFPTLDLLEGRQPDDLTARLTTLGGELGWKVIDLAGAFATDPATLFAPDDPVHPNAEGHHRAAAWIADALQQDTVLRGVSLISRSRLPVRGGSHE